MNKIVLDASAILALLNEEPGNNKVLESLPDAIISAVNFSEVIAVLINSGLAQETAIDVASSFIEKVIPFDAEQAILTACLRKKTKSLGLSLGDRACLALAKSQHCPALTADKTWQKIDQDIKIQVIR